MRSLPRWRLALCASVLCIVTPPRAMAQAPPPDVATAPEIVLQVGPIEGFTTAWHPAPATTAVPLEQALDLRVALPSQVGPASFTWFGAQPTERGSAAATCVLTRPGEHVVHVSARTSDPSTSWSQTLRLFGVPIDADQVAVAGQPTFAVAPLELDSSGSDRTAHELWFGESIAPLHELAPDHLVTSVARTIEMRAATNPPGFEPLLEWRANGVPIGMGALDHSFANPGSLVLDVGTEWVRVEVALDLYSVAIEMEVAGSLAEGLRVDARATTTPAGFEPFVRWMSSTAFGSVFPATGQGAEFSAFFQDPVGPNNLFFGGLRAGSALGPVIFADIGEGLIAETKALAEEAKEKACDLAANFGTMSQSEKVACATELKVRALQLKSRSRHIVSYAQKSLQVAQVAKAACCPCPTCDSLCTILGKAITLAQEAAQALQEVCCFLIVVCDFEVKAIAGTATQTDADNVKAKACSTVAEICDMES